MRVVFGISLGLLAAGSAQALSPPWILCQNADGSYVDYIYVHDANDDMFPNMTTFTIRDDDGSADTLEDVIAHCATRQAVIYRREMSSGADEQLRRAIEGERKVTLRQLAKRLKAKGVYARYVKLPSDHCACRPETHEQSF